MMDSREQLEDGNSHTYPGTLNIGELCQCCLSSIKLQKMLDNCKEVLESETYCDMLEYSFAIQVNTLSRDLWICFECAEKLIAACHFRKQIEKTQILIWDNINVQTKFEDTLNTLKKDDLKESENAQQLKLKLECDQNNFDTESIGCNRNDDFSVSDDDIILRLNDEKGNLILVTSNLEDSRNEDDPSFFVNPEDISDAMKRNKIKKPKKHKIKRLKTAAKSKVKKEKRLLTEKTGARKDLLPFKVNKKLNNRKCELCAQEFVCYKDLQNHMHEHYPDHVCHICGRFYATGTTLKSHMERVHGPPKFKCPECGKQYRNRYSIKSHVLAVHQGQKLVASYKCSDCSESFPTYYRRVVHMVEKHGFEPYKCQECGKGFINCGTLRTHVRRDHRMERRFQCEMCIKSFFSNKDLVKHMICHTGEKVFKCEICLKSYARKKTLIEHMKSHNPIKAHICSFCGRGFTQKCTLNVHLRTHEREQIAI